MLPSSSVTEFFIFIQGIIFLLIALSFGAYYLGARRPKQGVIAASVLSVAALSFASPAFLSDSVDPLAKVIEPYKYNIARWELGSASSQLTQRLFHPFSHPDPTSVESVTKLKAFFEVSQEISRAKSDLAAAEARLQMSAVSTNIDSLDTLHETQKELKFEAELILERLIAIEAEKEGLTRSFMGLSFLWPPVGVSIESRPGVLAVSPRDRIALQTSVLLNSGISRDTREEIEKEIAHLDLSGLIVGIGGVATYPAILPDDGNLESALEIAAHEWLHHYLYFHPLGRNYFSGGEMTSINETVANMWGKEIGRRLYCGHFAACAPDVAQPGTMPPPVSPPPPANVFDFNREMRATRLRVDALLNDGKVQEAEEYMESRRKQFVERGYTIRKLNQAYFAFFGSYGDEPSVVSPVGDMLRLIRSKNDTIGGFVLQMQEVESYEQFEAEFAKANSAI